MKDAEIKILSLDIKRDLKQDKINLKSINKLIDQKYELKKNKMKAFLGAYAKIKNILSKEQKKLLLEVYKERYEHKDKIYKKGKCLYGYPQGQVGPGGK